MKLEICITADIMHMGDLQAQLAPVAREHHIAVTGTGGNSQQCILTLSVDEEAPDLLLQKIDAITAKLASRYPRRRDIDVQVKNIESAEPAIGSGDLAGPFSPVAGIQIVPWNGDNTLKPGERDIILEPSRAFGTGLHPSTRLCLGLLQQEASLNPACRLDSPAVLDIGCGSGILTIGALRMGAASVLGIEIDPEAVRVAGRNLHHNQLAGSARIIPVSWHQVTGQYDLVLANLVPSVLYKGASHIAERLGKQGKLITAGFRAACTMKVAGLFARYGLHPINRSSADDWGALLLTRK